ncbi:MAG: aspartyl protease [Nostoc sp. DedQUE11]|nr:aspartyl protease [Nostoc sp. DedQUE11]
MGQVIVTLTGTNRIDRVLAQRGFISLEKVRSCTLDDVLVDTAVTLLYLPASVISQLGLVQGGEVQVNTAARVQQGRIFRGVELKIAERQGTFDCLEITEIPSCAFGCNANGSFRLRTRLEKSEIADFTDEL